METLSILYRDPPIVLVHRLRDPVEQDDQEDDVAAAESAKQPIWSLKDYNNSFRHGTTSEERRYDNSMTRYYTGYESPRRKRVQQLKPKSIPYLDQDSPKRFQKYTTGVYQYAYDDEKATSEQPKRRAARRPSTSSKPSAKSNTTRKAPVIIATEVDARRHGIPAGYSLKHWDPTDTPVILLGSVFDANSLGKWIYDWTVHHHGVSTLFADKAGELWLELIEFAGRVKRADQKISVIRTTENREMLRDFLEGGEHLWNKFKQILKNCEPFMLRTASKDGKSLDYRKAGGEYVDSMFGKDRYLESTEKIMSAMRLWSMRFDANCEDILRRPGA